MIFIIQKFLIHFIIYIYKYIQHLTTLNKYSSNVLVFYIA